MLEALRLEVLGIPVEGPLDLFAGQSPRLREVHLEHVRAVWTSTRFTHLRTLRLVNIFRGLTASILLDILSANAGLTTLVLESINIAVDGTDDLRPSVELPELNDLRLRYNILDLQGLLLSKLVIPRDCSLELLSNSRGNVEDLYPTVGVLQAQGQGPPGWRGMTIDVEEKQLRCYRLMDNGYPNIYIEEEDAEPAASLPRLLAAFASPSVATASITLHFASSFPIRRDAHTDILNTVATFQNTSAIFSSATDDESLLITWLGALFVLDGRLQYPFPELRTLAIEAEYPISYYGAILLTLRKRYGIGTAEKEKEKELEEDGQSLLPAALDFLVLVGLKDKDERLYRELETIVGVGRVFNDMESAEMHGFRNHYCYYGSAQ